MLDGERVSAVGLGTTVLETNGRFFFPDGASLMFSAGRLTPPTAEKREVEHQELMPATVASRCSRFLTGGPPVEVIVVLGDVGEDAQPVRDLQRHHVLCVQQSRDPQLLLCHLESLGQEKQHKCNSSFDRGRERPTVPQERETIQLL